MRAMATAVPCNRCHAAILEPRRGLCLACYDLWLRTRPVGVGATCSGCGDRRHEHLRFYECGRRWVVLCHNCTARAETLEPAPARPSELSAALRRDRRGDATLVEAAPPAAPDRRRSERSTTDRAASVQLDAWLDAFIAHRGNGSAER
jgi:hypothetical protein